MTARRACSAASLDVTREHAAQPPTAQPLAKRLPLRVQRMLQ